MDYLIAVLLPQLLHGLVFGAALGLVALGLTVIFGLLGVMNFAHGELYMLGAYAGIALIGLTQSFWVALVAAPLIVGVIGAVTEVATLRPIYRREPLYGLILTFGLALVFREGVRQIWGGDMRRIATPVPGSTPLLGMTYPNYRLFLLVIATVVLVGIWLFFTKTRAGVVVRAAVQDAEMLDALGVNVPRVFTLTFAGSAALAALAGLLLAPLAVGVVAAVTEVATLRPIYRREPLYGLILTFGLALVFREGVRQIWGGDMRRILPPFTGSTPLLGMTYPNYRLFLLGFSTVLLVAIWLFFTKTRAGVVVRAAVQDAEMLDALGVDVPRVFTLTFAGSAALAALAGLLLAPVFTVYPQMGVELILLAFIVVILGGMGSMGGSVVAAFAIGIAQSLLTLWMNPQRVAIAIFAIMIFVLIVRPRGFFGREGVLE